MTNPTIALAQLQELAAKGPDVDVLRQMVQFMAQQLMELQVEGRCGGASSSTSIKPARSNPLPVSR